MPKVKQSLAESLVAEGVLTPEQLKRAQNEEKQTGQRLRKIIVKMGFVEEEDLVTFVSAKLGIPRIELTSTLIDSKLTELIPESLARKHEVIPILKIGNRLTCAMTDPWNVFALDELRIKTNMIIEPAVATESEIRKALDEYYSAKGSMEEIIQSIDERKLGLAEGVEPDPKKLEGITKEPVVIKLVNLMILHALQERASDVHIEPDAESLKIRIRVDGALHKAPSLPKHLQSAIVSRLKILANLDIAERRVPQDGRFTLRVEGKEIDIRVSCVPTIHGENVVLRLLDVTNTLLGLEQLGFSKEVLQKYEKLILRPYGILLVTGPTGGGKTTTLYASLARINSVEKNILTIEDPVEYRLPGIRQTQINPKVNLTFANALRSFLRQDPDVIMVGEIRDSETVEMAIQAALTGHLVLSTLHTNDAASAFTRLLDMGVEPFLVASSLIGVVAQRLVRVLCPDCREEYKPSQETLKELGISEKADSPFCRGKGCRKCMQTGYRGRISIFELLVPDEKVRNLVLAKSSAGEIKKYVHAQGMVTLKEDGIKKIEQGMTTVEEVLRVTREE